MEGEINNLRAKREIDFILYEMEMGKRILETEIQRFAQGKYSAFGALFEEGSVCAWDFLSEKCGLQSELCKTLHTQVMDRVFSTLLKEEQVEGMKEEGFYNMVTEISQNVWEGNQKLLQQESDPSELEKAKEQHFSQLKPKLKAKIEKKKANNPKFLSYYLEHFRYYFTGASLILGIGVFALLFGFISINKMPEIFANAKLLTQVEDQAFGAFLGKNGAQEQEILSGEAMWTSVPVRYRLGKGQLSSWNKQLYVAKKAEVSSVNWQALRKNLNLPTIKWANLGKHQLRGFLLGSGNMQVGIDLQASRLDLAYDMSALQSKAEFETRESAIKKKIKNQILALGLSLEHYGEMIVQDGALVQAFVPRKWYGKALYDENGQAVGMRIVYHKEAEQLISLENYDFQQYLVSKYASITQEDVLKKAEELGFEVSGAKTDAELLKRGELVYQVSDDMIVPAIKFIAGEKLVFVPII